VYIVHYSHNSVCCRRSVALWVTLLSRYTVFTIGWFTNLLWCDIQWNKAPHTSQRHIWRIYTLCPFSGREKNPNSSAVGWTISLASVCYGNSQVAQHLLRPHLVFQPIWGWGDLGSFQLPQSNSSSEEAW